MAHKEKPRHRARHEAPQHHRRAHGALGGKGGQTKAWRAVRAAEPRPSWASSRTAATVGQSTALTKVRRTSGTGSGAVGSLRLRLGDDGCGAACRARLRGFLLRATMAPCREAGGVERVPRGLAVEAAVVATRRHRLDDCTCVSSRVWALRQVWWFRLFRVTAENSVGKSGSATENENGKSTPPPEKYLNW